MFSRKTSRLKKPLYFYDMYISTRNIPLLERFLFANSALSKKHKSIAIPQEFKCYIKELDYLEIDYLKVNLLIS